MTEAAVTTAGEGRTPSNGASDGMTRSTSTDDNPVATKDMVMKNSQTTSTPADGAAAPASASPKKRRKVNHGELLTVSHLLLRNALEGSAQWNVTYTP
ncbi:predicted protein [Uncinocarpus reesii 1704]|uniref:Uncharacterized protein n=1 Tax=Uncinocarpus reesii (strain UAMH 1704) TaxID=336963 RepID=C4JXM7_UNCRE|nr:uncharacterized protein UREG_06400 [Uncinocarpus reesii 1704]EEP81535.1 predicted protein [Uncinocarpus reesii 1704]